MKTENLAIVFIDIAGFTPRTSAQTREENNLLLRRFDSIVRPLVRSYSGRVVKTIGDAFLLTFRSPTDALLCSMAVHDRLAESNAAIGPAERFNIRAAVNVGEVRIEGGDVFGEAVNIAARIEGKAGAGEIYFSESAFLSMTRSEVPSVEVGYTELKGISDKVRLYRVPRADEGGGYALKQNSASRSANGAPDPGALTPLTLPFGGLGLNRVRDKLGAIGPTQTYAPVVEQAHGWVKDFSDFLRKVFDWWLIEIKRSRLVQFVTAVIVIGLVIAMVKTLKPKPKQTPWQKFTHSFSVE